MMKKIILMFTLLLVCFMHINVKADDVADEPKTCKVTVVFKEESTSGEAINSGNGVALNQSNTLSLNGTWNKVSRALSKTKFSSNSTDYTVDGWYDESGNPVPESMWYNASTPTRIRVAVKCTADMPDEITYTYILKWNAEKQPIYKFNVYDYVSTGSHHWDNTTGHQGSYTYTFSTPDAKTHYQLVYYKLGEQTFQPGDKYTHDVSAQGTNTEVVEDSYAYWQADVTLNLYDDNKKLISTESSFESVSINTTPEKFGYTFLGWFDENGNEVSDTTFYPNEMGTNPKPVEITLYAKFEQIKRDIEITKIWDDEDNVEGFRPANITVELLADGTKVDEATLSGEGNSWTHIFRDLVKFGTEKEIEYTINELKVDNYETKIEGFTITNSRKVEKVDVSVKKVWEDNDDQDEIRPKELVVTLSNGNKITLNDDNNWTATIKDLNKNADGKEIEYTWSEEKIEGYELTTSVEGYITTLTNTHKPEFTKLTVTKVWSDDNNESGKRPESITVVLKANDKEYDKVVLSEENNWTYTFKKLPIYADGEALINYTVSEENVPEGYEVAYEGDMNDGFTIHNVLGQGDGEPDTTPSNNPQTGDNIYLYVITLLISVAGIITGKVCIKRFN